MRVDAAAVPPSTAKNAYGDGDFTRIKRYYRTIALNNTQLAGRSGGKARLVAMYIVLADAAFNVALHRRLPREVLSVVMSV